MRCPFCGKNRDKVIDSRAADAGRVIRRRRECLDCQKRFTTYEHVDEKARVWVIKKDGVRVPYDRQKVLDGLEKACYKRPISVDDLTRLAESVEEDLFARHDREVQAADIGQAVAERLRRIDQVAYVRFASVYKQFRSLDDFVAEVRDIFDGQSPDGPGQGRLF